MYILRPYQTEAVEKSVKFLKSPQTNHGLLILPTGCHTAGHPILLFDGTTKKVEDIVDNDLIMGNDSTSRKILRLIKGFGSIYKITPIRGEPFEVNEDHILHLHRTNVGGTAYGNIDKTYPKIVNVSVKDYLSWAKSRKHVYKVVSASTEYESRDTTLDPYFVGLWLAEGSKTPHHLPSLSINSNDVELLDWLKGFGATQFVKHKGKNCYLVLFTKKGIYHRGNPNPIELELRKCIFGYKDIGIPHNYLINSKAKRLEILAGLLDGDGYSHSNGFEIVSKYPRLSKDIQRLSRSLGLSAFISPKVVNGVTYFRISISGDCSIIPNKLTS